MGLLSDLYHLKYGAKKMGAAAPYLVNLKSNTMKNTPQIYSIISTTANNS